jgi:hypothetical protein
MGAACAPVAATTLVRASAIKALEARTVTLMPEPMRTPLRPSIRKPAHRRLPVA